MTENRTERTPLLGLLALMQSPAGGGPGSAAQGWGFPYWNQRYLDALIAALHEAPRTGVALLTAPSSAPTVALSATPGYLPAGLNLEVVQTWVDEWGRETDAGVVGSIYTGAGIPDPIVAPILGAPSSSGTGFDGGLLEVAYCWIDEMAGESLPSPVAQVDVPYRTGGLQSEVPVTLPATPASVGAAGAFIYARHRSGNWVRAAAISDPAETEVTLDGTWISCFVSLPLTNSTGAGRALDITGVAAPAAAALTHFYIRSQGEGWTAGDRRLRVGGADEWDPATITYPLVFRGGADDVAPGYPPPLTQIRPIRKIDLGTEADGAIGMAQLPEEAVLEEELARTIGACVVSGMLASPQTPASMQVAVGAGEALLAMGRVAVAAAELVIPAADGSKPRIDLVCLSDEGTLEGPSENGYLKGTADSHPVPPNTPAGYLLLAEVTVEAGAAQIEAADIADKRWRISDVMGKIEALMLADSENAGDLADHAADENYHASKPGTIATANTTCDADTTNTFTIADMPSCLVTELKIVATSGGVIDYDIELYSDSNRTVLQYQAGNGPGEGIEAATFVDRIPWEWFGGATVYGRVTNRSVSAISDLAISIKYRR